MAEIQTFRIDRSLDEPLHDQLFRQLKGAIASGRFRAGQALPSIGGLSKMAGVSGNTARHALLRLAAEGLTTMRRHVGSIVTDRAPGVHAPRRILFFTPKYYFNFYYTQLLSEIRMRLVRDGRHVQTSLASGYQGRDEFRQLEERLGERWDLIVEIGTEAKSRKAIEDSGWPFISIANGWSYIPSKSPFYVGGVDLRIRLAVPDFVADCVRKGVKSVLQFLDVPHPFDAAEQLAVSEIATETVAIGTPDMPEEMSVRGLKATRNWLRAHRHSLPDVIFFTDDYIAQGGLCAIQECELKIPDDVAVVVHANKGHGPIWSKPLTRLELDTSEHGKAIAAAISGFLTDGFFPGKLILGSKYIHGQSF